MNLSEFVRESNRIENIHRDPTDIEIAAHQGFLNGTGSVAALEGFVQAVQPGAVLRRRHGLNVRVGLHIPPPGSPMIEKHLADILNLLPQSRYASREAYRIHVAYENLHPFTDGNGRSGRVLWLRMMGGLPRAPLGFLHHFYYQALDASRSEQGGMQ